MTTLNTIIEEEKKFKEALERVCKFSGKKYCPGCGLTVEGFEHFLTSAMQRAYDLGYNDGQHDD